MALQPTLTVIYNCVGAIGGSDSIYNSMAAPANTNAPPPTAAALQAGNNTILIPASPYVVTVAFMRPPSNSVNVKTLKGISGDTGLSSWTNQPVVIPCTAGESIVIGSVGSETIEINFG
jgi:hypothetical protein